MGLKQRREAAFESLYSRHVRDVYGYALAMLGSAADAEDVTQTTFLNAYRALERGERPRTPRSWLLAIARNVCRQRFRQAARRPREVELDDAFAVQQDADAPNAGDIARALRSLPFAQRSALVMRELEGCSQAEIADALGVSVSAVETLLFRARRGMREQLESTLTCGEAARAISRQLDGAGSRAERAALRAHLRVCDECATFARRARAHRGAMRRLRALPLPASLLSWSIGGAGAGAVAGAPAGGLGLKLLAGAAAAAVAAGATERVVLSHHPPPRVAEASVAPPAVGATNTVSGHRAAPAAASTPGGEDRPHADANVARAGHGKAGVPRHRHAKARGHAKAVRGTPREGGRQAVATKRKRAAPGPRGSSRRPTAQSGQRAAPRQRAAPPKPTHSSKAPRSSRRPASSQRRAAPSTRPKGRKS
jgi:RNA polymerase sigma-70 factor (ECF subfamily)